ncbi:MAG TPA: aromatic ring-hydroxylating dioxygenase subunit alpha [Polyangiaceae bacterium]|jgi:phenylpropionate dioxygenase-like ring-hydroxylating dioxygenase large terminal subunit
MSEKANGKANSGALVKNGGLLKNYWYAAARSDEVTHTKPLGRTVLGEMLVLWRSGPGAAAVVMRDRCLHRNALLSEGDLFDGCIGCPYHGWTYDTSGRCVQVPSEGSLCPPTLKKTLHSFTAKEQDGLVWVWMGEGAPDKEPFRMPYWDTPGWGAYYMTTPFSNGVTNLVENFMDVPHTVFVHKGWFRDPKRTRVEATVERTADSVLVTYDQPHDSIGFTGRILNPQGLPLVHTDKFYLPNNTRVDYVWGDHERAFVITSTSTPVSDTESLVFTLISYKLGALQRVGQAFLPWYTRRVIEQDVEIMEIQARGIRRYGEDFASTPADTLHVHIESLRDWAAAGGVGARPEPRVDRMEFWI